MNNGFVLFIGITGLIFATLIAFEYVLLGGENGCSESKEK